MSRMLFVLKRYIAVNMPAGNSLLFGGVFFLSIIIDFLSLLFQDHRSDAPISFIKLGGCQVTSTHIIET